MPSQPIRSILEITLLLAAVSPGSAQTKMLSHPPVRPLPQVSSRPMDNGPTLFVDAARGNDRDAGSESKPWRTLGYALSKAKPGDTLYLRGGTYFERVKVSISGTPERPITIRSYPGELATLDGGIREFFESPAKAWEPCPGGVEGEYRSTNAYPDLGSGADGFNTHAYFGDSMIPLQGYRFLADLRDPSMVWDLKNKVGTEESVYCGPGVFYDVKSGRFHARLAHTNLKTLGDDNYRGETDPRKLPLVVAAWKHGSTLSVRDAHDLRFQDLVVRGSATAAIEISDSERLTFEGVTAYAGRTAFQVRDTAGLKLLHTACRGIGAPWTFRGHLKYRSSEARLFSAGGWAPTGRDSRDIELAYCEFTDSVDGVFVGNVKGVRFHHNLLDNISDDGLFLTATTGYDGSTPGGDVLVYQNVLSRCLTTFAFGVGHGRQKTLSTGKQTGSGVHVFRNVFDFRRPVMYQFPTDPTSAQELPSRGRFASDHGSPAWEPMNIYHNTIIADDGQGYAYGSLGLGHTRQRVFNNIVVQFNKFPSLALLSAKSDLHADGNLFWCVKQGNDGDFLTKFRQSKVFGESKQQYPPGWTSHDLFADPKFVKLSSDWRIPLDLRLVKGSPALDAGLAIPRDWPDPLRDSDRNKPDIGVLPANGETWRVGVNGRLTMFGEPKEFKENPPLEMSPITDTSDRVFRTDVKPAAIVEGYPEFDAPIVEYALKKQRVRVERLERAWLDGSDYSKYGLVVIAGDLRRAGLEHASYTSDELAAVKNFLDSGGTLLLLRRGKRVFDWSPEGKMFFDALTGRVAEHEKEPKMVLTQSDHPWVKHLDPKEAYPWLIWKPDNDNSPLRVGKGERIIASTGGTCLLYRVPVGKGQIIYMGWQAATSLPGGRTASTVAEEKAFEEQARVLFNIVTSVYPKASRLR